MDYHVFSSLLFWEKALRKTKELDKGLKIGGKINLLTFADDILQLAELRRRTYNTRRK